MTTIEALASATGDDDITPKNGYNVYRFDDPADASKQTLLGTFATELEAVRFARRNGGHQVQLGPDGEVLNLQTDGSLAPEGTETETVRPARRYRWVIEIDASEDLVADGFDPANQVRTGDAGGELSALGRIVDNWEPRHCRLRIVEAPAPADVAKARG